MKSSFLISHHGNTICFTIKKKYKDILKSYAYFLLFFLFINRVKSHYNEFIGTSD